ncbi:MAG: CBS domain-containing protein [Bacilli bacterium]|nr:CBS domain-containing protein [Bacilli bacterium]
MKVKELLLSKSKCCHLYSNMTIDQALRKMGKDRYQTVPVLEKDSDRYLYSISEGDILFKIKDLGLPYPECCDIAISCIETQRLYLAVREDSELEDVYDLLINQNFVPVVAEGGAFKGILTRRAMLDVVLENQNKGK